ncbi:hypothetical protein CZ794_06035 [Psychrobacter sp. JB385]|nr:hypothetical protein CZ794_06035 [Psychrobacter sp. JB385]
MLFVSFIYLADSSTTLNRYAYRHALIYLLSIEIGYMT